MKVWLKTGSVISSFRFVVVSESCPVGLRYRYHCVCRCYHPEVHSEAFFLQGEGKDAVEV